MGVPRTGRASEGMSVSTGHLFGTEQLHPLRDCGCTLWQEGEGYLLKGESSLTSQMCSV